MRGKMQPEPHPEEEPRRNENEEIVLPVVDEQVVVGKRTVETGAVQARKHVEQRVQTVEAPLIQETVEVRRVPVNKEVSEMPRIVETAEEIVIPVVEEELVVSKRLILKEEVHVIRRRTKTRTRREVTLAREKAEVVRVKRGRDE